MRNARVLMALIIASTSVNQVLADGAGDDRNSRLEPFQGLIEDENYQGAIDKLQVAMKESPDDADLLNLTAYSQRKLERFDDALVNYQKALKIDPEHRGANEYLGELYLQLGQLDKAQERLKVLDDACFFGCDEFDELEEAIETYRAKNQ